MPRVREGELMSPRGHVVSGQGGHIACVIECDPASGDCFSQHAPREGAGWQGASLTGCWPLASPLPHVSAPGPALGEVVRLQEKQSGSESGVRVLWDVK